MLVAMNKQNIEIKPNNVLSDIDKPNNVLSDIGKAFTTIVHTRPLIHLPTISGPWSAH